VETRNESFESRRRGGETGHISEAMKNLGKPVTRICRDCGEEFEAIYLGPATAQCCRRCAAQRYQRQVEAEEESRRQEEEGRMRRLVWQANLPPKWREVRFGSSDPNKQPGAFKFAMKYAEGFSMESPSLIFYSPGNGTGKSHLASCILNHVLYEKRIPVRWEKARDVMLELRRTFSDRELSEASVLDRISYASLLVLDDVGRDPASQWIHTTYWQLLDRRVEWRLPIIITTNLPLDSEGDGVTLADQIGEGSVSRLREICQGHVVDLSGPDLR
jgi:DNA replication protein DnaC